MGIFLLCNYSVCVCVCEGAFLLSCSSRSCADISFTSAFNSRISVEFQSETDAVTIATVLRDPFNISISLGGRSSLCL